MSDWAAGYMADIDYPLGYYPELNPLRLSLAFLNAGLSCPEVTTACELGFGQGLSVNIHAAASTTHWTATDFNPGQVCFARELGAASGAGAKLYDDAFADFANRSDLPDFDYIGLHGIWSWISDENRTVLVDFVRRKLKVGGVLYISYNTQPGWSAFAPIRHLLAEHAAVMGAAGHGMVNRVNSALGFTEELLATNPGYSRANPQIAEQVQKLKGQNRHYLAHEYFNRHWHPMHFSTMAQWLEPAKVGYACSAHYPDHIASINLTADQQAFLNSIPDALFRETVRDFMMNQQFRRDYWVKGTRRLGALEQLEKLHALRIILAVPRSEVSLKVDGALGEVTLAKAVYDPILDLLADYQPKTLGQLEHMVKGRTIPFSLIMQAVMLLAGTNHLAFVQGDDVIARVKGQSDRLNGYVLNKARSSGDIGYLASPVTGGGVSLERFQQLFLLALKNGKRQPADWVQFVWQLLAEQGQMLTKEGQPVGTPEDTRAELTRHATEFADKRLPVLKALGIT